MLTARATCPTRARDSVLRITPACLVAVELGQTPRVAAEAPTVAAAASGISDQMSSPGNCLPVRAGPAFALRSRTMWRATGKSKIRVLWSGALACVELLVSHWAGLTESCWQVNGTRDL